MKKQNLKKFILVVGLIALPGSYCLYKENEIINKKVDIIETYGNEPKKDCDNSKNYISGYKNGVLKTNEYISEMGLSNFDEFKSGNYKKIAIAGEMVDYTIEEKKGVTYQNGYEDAIEDEYNSYLSVINNEEYEETYASGYAVAQKMYDECLKEGCADLFFEQYRNKYKDTNVSDSFKKGYNDAFSKLSIYYQLFMEEYGSVDNLSYVDINGNIHKYKTNQKVK